MTNDEINNLEEQMLDPNAPMKEDGLEQAEPDETGEPIAEVSEGHGLHAGPLGNEEPITIDEVQS